MTEHASGHRPAAPAILGRHAAYYREKAAECHRLVTSGAVDVPDGSLASIERERDLWTQLADEIDAYLEDAADGPGLF